MKQRVCATHYLAVELKITEFRPEYASKMNFYLSLRNEQLKKPHEQPSVGIIIICQSKQRTVAGFALREVSKPIGVATYSLTDTLPAELRPLLLSNEELVVPVTRQGFASQDASQGRGVWSAKQARPPR